MVDARALRPSPLRDHRTNSESFALPKVHADLPRLTQRARISYGRVLDPPYQSHLPPGDRRLPCRGFPCNGLLERTGIDRDSRRCFVEER